MASLDGVFAYVEVNLEGRIKVAALAQIAQLSPTQFSRVFKSEYGVSPGFYVRLRRIGLAMILMRTTTEPLSAIALLSGHCDQSHFTRVFNRMLGMSPRRWRHRIATRPSCGETSGTSDQAVGG